MTPERKATFFFRKVMGEQTYYAFESIKEATESSKGGVSPFMFKGELEVVGEFKTIMVPVTPAPDYMVPSTEDPE